MLTPPIPPDETQRLETLRDLEILDTEPEPVYDDLTRLAARICETPISLMSFIDGKRQWMKSAFGMVRTEIPRDLSLCAHTILHREGFEIRDARIDPRFFDHPLVRQDPRVRFYSGIPLFSGNGHAVGTLCVIGHEPASLTWGRRQSLETLARQASTLVEMRSPVLTSARLAALGEVAAGVVHEITNPLAIAVATLGHLERMLKSPDGARTDRQRILDRIDMAEKTLGRITLIIRGMKNVSRDGSLDTPEPHRISTLLEETMVLLKERIRSSGVIMKIVITDETAVFPCRAGQISQVLLNLIGNALDAVEHDAAPWIEIRAETQGERGRICITDSGNGIPPEIRQRLMQPFFTTKKAGRGTGLGLRISKRIIETHGGKLYYDENSPHTRFVIELPCRNGITSGTSPSP